MSDKKTWLVVGACSVIGRAFAREAANNGNDVILLDKDAEDLEITAQDVRIRYPGIDVSVVEFDPFNVEAFPNIVEVCEKKTKNIISVFSALETAYTQKECGKDLGKIKNMFQINYFSQIYFLTAVADLLLKQACGDIIVIGSVAGEYGMPDNYAYGSTKAALHVWLQGFSEQFKDTPINFTTVKVDDKDVVGGKRKSLFAEQGWDMQKCAKACLEYVSKRTKVAYYPRYLALESPLRRFKPFWNRNHLETQP
ncbi:MAG: SDR family NAD(P)-dependent oxidoreductase [Alphaproteobacteria bacterium]|nr:SDR family NAD(P)-dependent oxidoreductase [Alphaproteobacteria bacterium]